MTVTFEQNTNNKPTSAQLVAGFEQQLDLAFQALNEVREYLARSVSHFELALHAKNELDANPAKKAAQVLKDFDFNTLPEEARAAFMLAAQQMQASAELVSDIDPETRTVIEAKLSEFGQSVQALVDVTQTLTAALSQ